MVEGDSFVELPLTKMNSAIVPVVVVGPGCFKRVGTAFNIAPTGLFVTARHILDGRGGALEVVEQHPESQMAVVWVRSGVGDNVPEVRGHLIPISNWTVYDEPESDLAIFLAGLLEDGEPVRMPIVPLSSRPPKIGETIATTGYPRLIGESETSEASASEQPEIPLLHVATGKVVERFLDGRDIRVLPWPTFQTDAVLLSGMSGGPIFHRRGYVCGVNCSSYEPNDDYPHYSSYASLALALYPLHIRSGKNSYTVYELVKRGFVFTDDEFDRLQPIEQDGEVVGVRLQGMY